MKFKKGISLLEVMLSLAIIAVILILALRFYNSVVFQENVNESNKSMQAIRAASAHWMITHDNSYKDIDIEALIERNLLPERSNFTPWGTTVEVSSDGPNYDTFTVKLNHIPTSACHYLESLFTKDSAVTYHNCQQLTPPVTTSTLTVTFRS